MQLENISTRFIMDKISAGWNTETLCNQLGCSSEQFDERIRFLYSREVYRGLQRDLKKNNKKPQPKLKKCSETEEELTNEQSVETEEVSTEPTEGISEETLVKKPSREESLKKLRELASELSESTQRKEARYEEVRKSQPKSELKELHARIVKLRKEMMISLNEYRKYLEIINQNIEEMNAIWEERNRYRSELFETLSKIKCLETVIIFIYENGLIEVADKEYADVVLDDTGYEELFSQFLVKPVCQEFNLRINDIKTLARIICIEHNSSLKIEFVFDNDDIGFLYENREEFFS